MSLGSEDADAQPLVHSRQCCGSRPSCVSAEWQTAVTGEQTSLMIKVLR